MDSFNYFNYFTEIEEYFWRKRGAHLLVSPLDWAIVETWQRAGIPLDAVLRGIDKAFESYQNSKRGAGRPLKSLAYCVDAVLDAAVEKQEAMAGAGPEVERSKKKAEPFSRDELRNFLQRNMDKLNQAAERVNPSDAELARRIGQARASLADVMPVLDSPADLDIESLERRLSAVEEKMSAALLASADENILVDIRTDLDKQLAPYRRRMSAEQLSQLERQYVQKRLLERFGLPRLSLFYLN